MALSIIERLEKYAPEFLTEVEARESTSILKGRNKKSREVSKIQNQLRKDVTRLQADQNKAMEAVKAAEAVLLEKKKELGDVSDRLRNVRHQADRQVSRLHGFMFETADPAIDEAIGFFNAKIKWLRSTDRIVVEKLPVGWSLRDAARKFKKTTNRPFILAALEYCRKSVETLQDMKLDPVLDMEKIETLKNGIPDISQQAEITT